MYIISSKGYVVDDVQQLLESLETIDQFESFFASIYSSKHHFVFINVDLDLKVSEKRLVNLKVDSATGKTYTSEELLLFLSNTVEQQDEETKQVENDEDEESKTPAPRFAYTPSLPQQTSLTPEIIKT